MKISALGAAAMGISLNAKPTDWTHPWPSDVKKSEHTSIKTLLISSHPYPESSALTRGLEAAARSVDGVEVRNLEAFYGFDSRAINGDKEREITRKHDRVVLLFPTHWFNVTPM